MNYQFVISLIFIVLSYYYVTILVQYISNKIKNKKLNPKLRKIMKKINSNEKQYLMKFFNRHSISFDTSTTVDISNAIVNLLQSKCIINVSSSISIGFTEFDYYLQPWALEYLNELLNDGKIVVYDNNFEWND